MNTTLVNDNIMLLADSYKYGHYKFYLPDTQYVYSYLEPRKGCKFPKTVFFGLQYILKRYLEGQVVTKEKIDEAQKIIDGHLGPGVFNRKGWEIILNDYNGCLPIEIKAVPEGTIVDEGNVLVTVVNTDNRVPWLTNYIETILMNVWYPTTVATLSYELKKLLVNRLKETGCEIEQTDFMLHNFGMRSCALVEAGAVGSMAHLTAFKGTDTVSALPVTMNTYNVKDVPGYSVFATEHSIMTQLGEDNEMDVVENILDNVPDDALISIVIDSYDYKQFLIKFYNRFAKRIMNRKGRVVFRPDSGDPPEVALDCVRTLAEMYGFTTNDKGFNTLDPHVRVLYGDGINLDSIAKILDKLQEYRYSAENLVFGMGGALVNGVTRDTQRFAFKCSARFAGNEWHDVKKKPIDESKASKPGRLRLIKEGGKFVTVKIDDPREGDYLVTVFKNGKLIENYNFDDIRVMVNNQIINEGR